MTPRLDRLRPLARVVRIESGRLVQLRALPPRVAWFHWRARMRARRIGDDFSLISASPPRKVARLLRLAEGHRSVAELGTATGWTAIALALADPGRSVVTFDPVDRPERRHYLDLVPASVRERIEYVAAPGASAPREVTFLYIDSSHARGDTREELAAWLPVLPEGAVVVFDDYAHPDFPGVREAVEELGLAGEPDGALFVHRVAARTIV